MANLKKKVPRILMWIALLSLLLFLVLSIYAAFIGVENARNLFNSIPLQCFWVLLTVVLLVAPLAFASLRKKTGLLLIHSGCVMILAGGMWGSEAGHQWRRDHLQSDKVQQGYTFIYENEFQDKIFKDDLKTVTATLPFRLFLDDFRMEYYWERGSVMVYDRDNQLMGQFSAQKGTVAELPGLGRLEVVDQFKNYQRDLQNRRDGEGDSGGINPAVKITYTQPNGAGKEGLIFERFPDFQSLSDSYKLYYSLMPSDYFSDLKVFVNNKSVDAKTVEVNYPLHYGGYYFYQADYDQNNHEYTVLSITSDTGVGTVYSGFISLCGGLIWQCWFVSLRKIGVGRPEANSIQPSPNATIQEAAHGA